MSSTRSKKKTNDSIGSSSPCTESESVTTSSNTELPSWLNIYLCAALGSQANVFQLLRVCPAAKLKSGGSNRSNSSSQTPQVTTNISIHPQASPVICRHVLDTLISLAKSFPNSFLPVESPGIAVSAEGVSISDETADKSKLHKSTTSFVSTDFWNMLVRLDSAVFGKRGKSVQRNILAGQSGPNSFSGEFNADLTGSGLFELSTLGQLMTMVAHPVIRRSQLLTDRLLRLLSLVSVGLADAVVAQLVLSHLVLLRL